MLVIRWSSSGRLFVPCSRSGTAKVAVSELGSCARLHIVSCVGGSKSRATAGLSNCLNTGCKKWCCSKDYFSAGSLTILLKSIGNTSTPCKMNCQYQYQYKFQKKIFQYQLSNTNTSTILFLILILQSLNAKKSFYWDSFQVIVKLVGNGTSKKQTSPNFEVLLDWLTVLCNFNKTKIVWILPFCSIKVLTIGISRNLSYLCTILPSRML